MPKVRVAGFSLSQDGYGAGPQQGPADPTGKGGLGLFQWYFTTRSFGLLHGAKEGGTTGIDNDFVRRCYDGVGAVIMGRNMFAPTRGPWQDETWQGWWGDTPPFHTPVFVLTNYPRKPIVMQGGTTYHFVTGGLDEALQRAKEVAGEKDVRIGGGVATVRNYLRAGLIDEMHLVYSPVFLGSGEAFLYGFDLPSLGFSVTEYVRSEFATHIVLSKEAATAT